MRNAWLLVVVFLSLITVSLSGCFSSHPKNIEAFLKPRQANVTSSSYILQPPDEIEVYCTKAPEIHGQRQQIRPDGMVSFENIGEIMAAGRTPDQLAELIKVKLSGLYVLETDKPIDVRVSLFESKKYYVLGQVYLPGPKVYTGRDTVLAAIAEAQPNPMAWVDRIQVIRPAVSEDGKPMIFEVNFDRMAAHGDMSKNVLLQEGDVIYVPPTVLAAIALKVEEFIRPIGRAFSTVNIVSGTPGYR
jgi:polysaccharide export outer membrane protein